MLTERTNDAGDPAALALAALAALLADEARARRFLDLTGLDVDTLRARAGTPELLVATVGFLEAYEPDLVAVAAAIGVPPEALIAAGQELGA